MFVSILWPGNGFQNHHILCDVCSQNVVEVRNEHAHNLVCVFTRWFLIDPYNYYWSSSAVAWVYTGVYIYRNMCTYLYVTAGLIAGKASGKPRQIHAFRIASV